MMNHISLIGRLSRQPELTTKANFVYCRFYLMVNRPKTKMYPEPKVDVIRCVVYNVQAETMVKYLTKGSLVALQGRLQVDIFPGSQADEDFFITEVKVRQLQFLESKAVSTNRLLYSQSRSC